MKKFIIYLFSISLILLISGVATADTITPGFTFSVADGYSGSYGQGTHFHSNTGGAFGNPDGKAEVGDLGDEEVRGLSEYNLAGLGVTSSAFVTFNVFNDGGLFPSNDNPFTGDIDIVAYQGNNLEDLSDWEATSIGSVGSFNTAGLSVGDILSFDILSIFNDAINNAWASLGIRLQVASGTDPEGGAWTFDTLRLTTTDESTNPVPEPTTMLLLGTGLVGLAGIGRKKFFKKP